VVVCKSLPVPDMLDFTLPEKHVCLVTDDGTPVTCALARALLAQGWPVVVLRLPDGVVQGCQPLPDGAASVELAEMSEAALQSALAEVAGKHGPVAAFIHLAPSADLLEASSLAFSEAEKSLLKLAFLAAKHLKPALTQAAQTSRATFMTVTRLDGEFGLGGGGSFSPVTGGLFGLVKTLNLEWDAVFCRAVDLSPALPVEQAVEHILVELHDFNLLVTEVGYNANNERTTLALANVPSVMPVTGGKR
jgi:NAD(P)-dependent dehydrogenase (short-subunit alcohol dehydrogenase family)